MLPPLESSGHLILDAMCGSRAMWFDKNDNRALYVDIREGVFPRVHHDRPRSPVVVSPDVVASATALPYEDNTFYHVVLDPPHIINSSASGNVAKYYGVIRGDWEKELREIFSEGFRVLRHGGTLVFKWNETSVPIKKILTLTPYKPLYGHKSGKAQRTHWCVFIKEPLT